MSGVATALTSHETKHLSLFCIVFLRASLGLWRHVASDFKTFNEGRVFESSQSKDTPGLFNPQKSLFLGIPRVHIPLSWKLLPWKLLKAQDPRSKVTVGWHLPHHGSEKHNSSSMLLCISNVVPESLALLRISTTQWCTHRKLPAGKPTSALLDVARRQRQTHHGSGARELCDAQFFGGNKSGLSQMRKTGFISSEN